MIRKFIVAASLAAAAWPGMASAAWQEASSAHFIVYADDKPERVRAFTDRLERFDKALRFSLGKPDGQTTAAERVRVYMVSGISAVQKLAGKDMKNVAGFYQSRVGGPIAFVPRGETKDSIFDLDSQTILFHEYTHHWMFMNFPNTVFPAWFVEGFAEFNATAEVNKDNSVSIGKPPVYRAFSMTDASVLSAARMLQLDPGKLSDSQQDALYARGWLLTHMLTFDKAHDGLRNKYLAAINSGKSADDAAKVFGDLKKLDRDMTAYINGKISYATIAAASLPIGPVALRQLTPGEAAVMPAVLQSTRGVDDRTAQAVALLARKLAAPFPNDAGAQNELAEAEYDAGNLAEADAAAARALAADPNSVHALLYRGMVKSAQLIKADDMNVDHWKIAQGWFLMANKVDPDDPRAFMLYYRCFIDSGRKPTKNAEDGLIEAYLLAPFAYDLRMNAAAILLRRGEKDRARNALLPVAYSPHRESYAALAFDALTAIDAGNIDAAKRLLDRGDRDEEKATEQPADPKAKP